VGKLEGKIALVTGGSSGIGLATAKRFVQEGARVFITGRREKELAEASREIGNKVKALQGDVANSEDLDRIFIAIAQEVGRLDIVFANAGVAMHAPLGSISDEHYNTIFDINVKGVLFTVQRALPLIPDGGAIVLNSSSVNNKGLPTISIYSASKAAVRSFARTWTTELKARRIRVNAVSPGTIETPALQQVLGSTESGREQLKALSAMTPIGRIGTPDEIAKAVVFLASDDASFVTGVELAIDGGFAQV